MRLRAARSSTWSVLPMPGQLAGVDQLLPSPHIDRLLADVQIGSDLSNATTRRNQIEPCDGTRRDTSSARNW